MKFSQTTFSLCFFAFLLFVSCKNDDESAVQLNACGNPTDADVEDVRCQYKVTTLTEAFDGSGGLTLDADGFIYVANFGDALNDANGKEVSKIDPNTGEISVFATGDLDGASGNAFDSEGNLFQANIRGNFLSKITPDGIISLFTNQGLVSPVGVVIAPDDVMFVCNCSGGGSIQKITPEGVSTRLASSTKFNCPNGITMDEEGNLYPVNFGSGGVLKVSPDGTVSNFAVIPGSNNGHIDFANGKLYVVGRGANQIFEVTLEGKVALIAGTGSPGNADGDGDAATFNIPNGIHVSGDGSKIYVNDRLVGQGTPLNPVVVRVIELK